MRSKAKTKEESQTLSDHQKMIIQAIAKNGRIVEFVNIGFGKLNKSKNGN